MSSMSASKSPARSGLSATRGAVPRSPRGSGWPPPEKEQKKKAGVLESQRRPVLGSLGTKTSASGISSADPRGRVAQQVIDANELRHEPRVGIGLLRRGGGVAEPLVPAARERGHERAVVLVGRAVERQARGRERGDGAAPVGLQQRLRERGEARGDEGA